MIADFSLAGKNAIITGGAGILGPRFAEALAKYGANVAVVDVNLDAAQSVASDLAKRYSVKTKGIACDVTDKASVEAMCKEVDRDWGGIHILHNNAASKGSDRNEFFTPFEEFKLSVWREIMNVNVDGMFLVAQAVGKNMIERKITGSIIQTASIYGILGPDQRIYEGSEYLGRPISSPAVYSASKAAVIGLTNYLAAYWGHLGIRVNTLTPGGVESGQNAVFSQKYGNRIPLGRMAQADELTGPLLFLASDASSYMTGHNLVIDGGLTKW